jgi:hypothetical protein
VVGPGLSGKAEACRLLRANWQGVTIVEVSFGQMIKQDLANGDIPAVFIRYLWRLKQDRERQKPLNNKEARARALRILNYRPHTTPRHADEICRKFFAFAMKRFGTCYFVNRLESHIRGLYKKLPDSDQPVIILVGDIQLVDEAYWARVHAPLALDNEPTFLIRVRRGRKRPKATPRIENHHDVSELEVEPTQIRCDFVIKNNGSLQHLHEEVVEAIAYITREANLPV